METPKRIWISSLEKDLPVDIGAWTEEKVFEDDIPYIHRPIVEELAKDFETLCAAAHVCPDSAKGYVAYKEAIDD